MAMSVLVPLPHQPASWSHVGLAAIEDAPGTGRSMLCLRLYAMAPTLYLSLTELRALLAREGLDLAEDPDPRPAGHA